MNANTQKKIVLLPGEGIGIEVIAQSRRVLEWFIGHGLAASVEEHEYGAGAYASHGDVLSDAGLAAVQQADAVLFGSTGGPQFDAIPLAIRKRRNLLALRKTLGLYANLRPIVAIPALHSASSLKEEVVRGVDMMIVRELVGGIYFGEPRGIETLPNGERRGVNTQTYTSSEIRRIARFAFELARTRRNRVCSVDKANVMESGRLWREEVQALHDAEFADVELTHMLVDNCAMQLVRAPAQFDVMVTDNLFGDILSDCAAMVTGSLGMLPSASLGAPDATGRRNTLYEPVHGSAPDIAGKGIANPLGAILSLAMALRLSLGRPDHADLLERAVADTVSRGVRTRDIAVGGTPVSCSGMADAVIESLEALAGR